MKPMLLLIPFLFCAQVQAQDLRTPIPSSETFLLASPTPIVVPSSTVKKQYFIGGGGVRHLGSQLAFPFTHPVKFANNCSHPIRHPLVAFRQFSEWSGPHNNGMSFAASGASIAGSAALQTLWSNKHF
jgi:hypothetical protein